MYNKIIKRIKTQGLLSTINYLIFTVGFEKLGVEIIKHFSIKRDSKDFYIADNIVIFKAYEDIPEHILNDITKECGDSYLNYITTKKKENATLAVAIGKNGAVAGLSWLTLAKKHYKNSVQQYLIIHSCLTFPLYRGHGYYPKMILALCKTIFNDPNNTFDKVYMECSWANTASVKGILKCGFRDAGILISFRDKVLFEQMTF